MSGAKAERPGLSAALDHCRAGDTVVVWRLDRLGRSLTNLIELMTALEEKEIGFKSLSEQIDTTTSGGKLVFHIFGALAEFERELIRERTRAGLAAARARGRQGGRPKKLDYPEEDRHGASPLRSGNALDRRHLSDVGRVAGDACTALSRHVSDRHVTKSDRVRSRRTLGYRSSFDPKARNDPIRRRGVLRACYSRTGMDSPLGLDFRPDPTLWWPYSIRNLK